MKTENEKMTSDYMHETILTQKLMLVVQTAEEVLKKRKFGVFAHEKKDSCNGLTND